MTTRSAANDNVCDATRSVDASVRLNKLPMLPRVYAQNHEPLVRLSRPVDHVLHTDLQPLYWIIRVMDTYQFTDAERHVYEMRLRYVLHAHRQRELNNTEIVRHT